MIFPERVLGKNGVHWNTSGEAIVTDVKLGAFEPANPAFGLIPVHHPCPCYRPADECVRLFSPEAFRILP